MDPGPRLDTLLTGRRALLVVGLLTVAGFLLRLHQYGESLLGDELSTLWIVTNNDLAGTISKVSSIAEISPPLSFIASWFSAKLGSDPDLIRLPSLIAGTAVIPLTYLLGRKTVGRAAGLVAATVMTLSPFMTYFSGNGRGYMLLILLLIGSTLVMLKAAESDRKAWWVAYGGLSCLAMYTHYTAIFVLLAQYLWLLWYLPGSRLPATLANVGAALLFLPWLPSLSSDLDSPTRLILEALQGSGFTAKKNAVEQWAFGHPVIDASFMPGAKVMTVICAGLLLAAVAAVIARLRSRRGAAEDGGPAPAPGDRDTVTGGMVLVFAIALAAPLCEALLLIFGIDLLGSRNMTASWYGFSLAVGALVLVPGGVVSVVSLVLVLGGYGVAAGKMLQPETSMTDSRAAAELIDSEIRTGDVVVDWPTLGTTPVPATPLDSYMSAEPPEYRLGLPTSEPPFLPFTAEVVPPRKALRQAFRQAEGNRIFLHTLDDVTVVEPEGSAGPPLVSIDGRTIYLPAGSRIVDSRVFPSYFPSRLMQIEVGSADFSAAEPEPDDQPDHSKPQGKSSAQVAGN